MPQPEARFNVLLTEDMPSPPPEHWTYQLARLLEPQGVVSYVARSGREAIDLVGQVSIHAAVIDMATPRGDRATAARRAGAGVWLLELMRRLPERPPIVLVQGRATAREAERMLRHALQLGAFSVVDKPIDLEQMLAVFRRLVERQYRGQWPGLTGPAGPQPWREPRTPDPQSPGSQDPA